MAGKQGLCVRECVYRCVFMCAALQISERKHKGTEEWNDGFINSGTFDLCRTSLNDSQGLILADVHQILSLNILHTLWNSFIYVTLPFVYGIGSAPVVILPLLCVSDRYSSTTCFKTLYDGSLNRCLNQIVFHYTKNNITILTFQWYSLARGCCVPPSHLYALWICLR